MCTPKKFQKVAPKSTKQPSNTSIPNLNLQQYQKQQKITQQKTMATRQFQTSHLPPNTIKLPKITFTKVFRIRSASKQKNQQQNNQKLDTVRDSSGQKFRSNLLKLSNMNRMKTSTKIVKKKSEEDASGYDESVDVGSCRFNSKYSNQNNMEAMEKEHQRNMQKLTNIAKMFDPKTLMRLGSKNSQNSQQENNPKENKNKHMKGQIRVNQYIFEGKYQNKNKNSKDKDVDEYWKKVNESLILAPCKTMENEVSKDLREIFQTLVTE